ncbi:citrate lyase holo-[acyl-carrier protein] synthase [Lactobacillus sp. CBA3606]|nr:citrate lyase holo-[acyl-carrier protein] synthase [Lactobacillus sp. CBA3606]
MWLKMSNPFQNLTGPAITLPQMLATRDWRSDQQLKLLQTYLGTTLIWSSVRIPGPIKTGPRLVTAYQAILAHLNQYYGVRVLASGQFDWATGFEFYLILNQTASTVKQHLITIEQNPGFSQLCDLDVLTLVNNQLHQTNRHGLDLPVRPCLICGADAKVCSRSRRHGLVDVQRTVDEIITVGWREI